MRGPGRGGGQERGAGSPLFWAEKEEMTEGTKANRASETKPSPSPLAQGLDPPLMNAIF